jgi:hypothetical protein
VIGMSLVTFHGIQSKASTPPAEERVTSFFTRVKKEVTKKESTLRGAPGFTLEEPGSLRRWHLRVRRGRSMAFYGSRVVSRYRRCRLTAAHFLAPTYWIGIFRDSADEPDVKPGVPRNVLSFGDFSLHEQRKVTRSAAGRVEALQIKQRPTTCVG